MPALWFYVFCISPSLILLFFCFSYHMPQDKGRASMGFGGGFDQVWDRTV